MKKFIRNVVLFSFFALLFFVSVIEFLSNIINNKADFKLEKKPKYVVLGHSHPAFAYNDSLIVGCKNLGLPGEGYFYIYFKAKKIIEQNPSIETVFIEFSNNHIYRYMDIDWVYETKKMRYMLPERISFMGLSDKIFLLKNNPLTYIGLTSIVLQEAVYLIRHKYYKYLKYKHIGGYYYSKEYQKNIYFDTLSVDTAQIEYTNIPTFSLNYLDKIIEVCKKNKKELVLVRTPLHYKYSRPNERVYQKIKKQRYSSIELLDFVNFPTRNADFSDLQHMNHRGAARFSKWFNKLLLQNLLKMNNKQEFIDQKIQELKTSP